MPRWWTACGRWAATWSCRYSPRHAAAAPGPSSPSLPVLMRTLNEGLDLVRWPEPSRKKFFAELLPGACGVAQGSGLEPAGIQPAGQAAGVGLRHGPAARAGPAGTQFKERGAGPGPHRAPVRRGSAPPGPGPGRARGLGGRGGHRPERRRTAAGRGRHQHRRPARPEEAPAPPPASC
ncbi:hypothetical protein Ddc_23559 [Ditylenchus destructor]|nr:hypothetical protein Ddc_23559 [Ditylenchus destructor]